MQWVINPAAVSPKVRWVGILRNSMRVIQGYTIVTGPLKYANYRRST